MVKCYHCNKPGHVKRNCRKLHKPYVKQGSKADTTKVNVVKANEENNGFVYMVSESELNSNSFIIDSGATHHIVVNKHLASGFRIDNPICLGSFNVSNPVLATSIGTVNVRGDDETVISLHDVLYVPQGSANVLSVRKFQSMGMEIFFENDKNNSVRIEYNGMTLIHRPIPKNLSIPFEIEYATVNTVNFNQYELWHKRLGGSHSKAKIKQYCF